MGFAIVWLVNAVISLMIWFIIAQAILSWLVAFGVLNMHNRGVYAIGDFFHRITEPVLAPIRRVLPNLGGVDVSPIVVILLIMFARQLLNDLFFAL